MQELCGLAYFQLTGLMFQWQTPVPQAADSHQETFGFYRRDEPIEPLQLNSASDGICGLLL
ncbi:MAG: hypothetical protein DWI22_13035 [Planctomycetota bacterium]|nr:MAG: hypothetical protein DWI22_13035 [Planctomycetota bacterium]